MPKPFKSIDEQIDYLETKKSIEFTDKKEAYQFLLNNNYYQVVACGKVKFALDVVANIHQYEHTQFKDWQSYFNEDRTVSVHLRDSVLEIERKINARLSYFLSNLLESTNLTDSKRNTLMQLIKSARKNYVGVETWAHIPKMTFGEMKKLLFWLNTHEESIYLSVTEGYDFIRTEKIHRNRIRIDELNHLRNNVCHFRPLNIYLIYGQGKSQKLPYKDRKFIINAVLHENYNQNIKEIITSFFSHTDKFVKIKNSQQC